MDETIYKITLAAFLHDMGKFAERAQMNVTKDFLNNNAGLYQPFNAKQQRHTHTHAVYTAAFIDNIEKLLPQQFNKASWGLGDTFINLAAGHHKPETPLQWVVAMGDRVSSGFDRQEFESYNNEESSKGIPLKDYKKTRLLTLFEGLSLSDTWKDDRLESYAYRYPLKEMSSQNIFPAKSMDVTPVDGNLATTEYAKLFTDFLYALERLEHKQNIPLWFEHFDTLFLIFASHIPAATVGKVVPDISLYDHSKTAAAIATAVYKYHQDMETLDVEHVRNYDDKKFMLVSGDFYGIQDFIFTEGGSTGKASAKLLRGRSFSVSLITELAADMLCREMEIPFSSIILNAAGKFTILAPNTEDTRSTIRRVQETINDWLIKNFYGQSSLGISSVEASCSDFVSGSFPVLWEKLQSAMDRKKYVKFDPVKYGGVVADYLTSFNNTLEQPLCPFCGKRPSCEEAAINASVASETMVNACRICHDHIYIGEHLVKEDRIAITTTDADLKGDKLLEPLLGRYQLSFDVSGKLGDLAKTEKLLKYWDIGIEKDGTISKKITAKFLNGYVPKYSDEDNHDDRLLTGNKKDETKLALVTFIKEGVPKTFLHLAKKALNPTNTRDKFAGIEALGILKADVDNLGSIVAFGIKKERQTLSRLATLSRQLNNFFSIFLPSLLSNNRSFKDVYTVFAGGDDLFLIGPWNRIVELSGILNEAFRNYVCRNPQITLSAGISVHKPSDPVVVLAEDSERALYKSKNEGKKEKNRLTVFGETVTWENFAKLEIIKNTVEGWVADETLNSAMLYRLNEIIEMVRQESEIRKANYNFQIEDMECLKWRSKLKYSVVRNVGKRLKNEEKEHVVESVLKTVLWLEEYGSSMKIPLWQILYNNR